MMHFALERHARSLSSRQFIPNFEQILRSIPEIVDFVIGEFLSFVCALKPFVI
jgi:hypothetical protein